MEASRRQAFPGNVTDDVRGGLAESEVVGRGCGVANSGRASTDLANEGHGGGWDCSVGERCLGRDSDTSGRADGGMVGAFCRGCSSGGCGGVEGLPPSVSCRPGGLGIRGSISVVAGCDEREESASWIGAATIIGGGGGVFSIKDSNPVYALDCVSVDERAPNDVLGWPGDAGDRRSGGGNAVSTSDDDGSLTGSLDRPSGG